MAREDARVARASRALPTKSVTECESGACPHCDAYGFDDPSRFKGSSHGANEPHPHQMDAIRDVAHAFVCDSVSRAKLVMACGAGKTLTALWSLQEISRRIDRDCEQAMRTVIVFVPSLMLICQFLKDWREQWEDEMFRMEDVLTVCSDATVHAKERNNPVRRRTRRSQVDDDDDDDDDDMSPQEYEKTTKCKVTKEAEDICEWLERKRIDSESRDEGRILLILCTYQSSCKLKDAQSLLRGDDAETTFDFAIFDEAHRTAVREKSRRKDKDRDALFKLALKDENIRIKRRLFMTATPRIGGLAPVQTKDAMEDDAPPPVSSMDDEHVHGRIVHRLSFRDAIDLEIICGYKILVICVDETHLELRDLAQRHVNDGGDEIPARQLAKVLALKRACESKEDVEGEPPKKVLTFHRLNGEKGKSNARELTAASMKILAEKHMSDTDFEVLQIRGDDSTEDKERTLKAFRQAPRALLTNARALTEGVDVPAIDMVAFMTTKQSEVDIMQSAGRAMRKDRDRDNKVAYILLPVFIPSRDVEKSSSDVSAAKDEGQTSDAPSGVDKSENISTNGKISNERASRALGPRASEKRQAHRSTASDERDGTVTALKGCSTTNPLATASEAPVDGSERSDQTRRRRSQRGVGTGTRKDADETSILGSAEGYASVLAIIKAFCENDESLQDATKQLRYARGAGHDGTSPDARVKAAEAKFRELIRVECLGGQGSCVSASDIERAVRTVVLDATTSSWDEYLARWSGTRKDQGTATQTVRLTTSTPTLA